MFHDGMGWGGSLRIKYYFRSKKAREAKGRFRRERTIFNGFFFLQKKGSKYAFRYWE